MSQVGEDCYFYYYSSCTKGDQCAFRHCAQALGSETVCTLWKEGRCFRPSCMYRHMDIKVDRSKTPCYWETQPGGCSKPHCVFMHSVRKERGLLTQKNRLNPVPQPKVAAPVIPGGEMMIPGQRIPADLPDDVETIVTPQVAPLVVNPFDEESDADSSTSGSPIKTVKQLVRKPEPRPAAAEPKAVSRITFTNTQGAEKDAPAFGIKSLDDIRNEKLARAKEALAEADELLTSSVDRELLPSHSIDELMEDLDDEVKETLRPHMPQTSTRRIQLSAPSGEWGGRLIEMAADSTTPAPALGGRRIIVVDADSSEEKPIASPKKQPKTVLSRLGGRAKEGSETLPSSPKKQEQTVLRRLGGRTTQPRTDSPEEKRVASPKKKEQTVLLRLGGRAKESTSDGKSAKDSSIHSRLGLKRNISAADKEDKKSATGIRSRLGLKRQAQSSSSDEQDDEDAPSPSRLKARLGGLRSTVDNAISANSRVKLARLGEKSTKPTRSGIQARLGQIDQYSSSDDESTGNTWADKRRERLAARTVTEDDSSHGTDRVTRIAGQRGTKQEQKIYRPPAAKTEETNNVTRVRLEPRVRPERTERAARQDTEQKKKPTGWGVKTFSEIMAEKRKRRLAAQDDGKENGSDEDAVDTSDAASSVKSRLGPLPAKSKMKRSISPISFSSKDTENEPKPKKQHKFTPVVFNNSGDTEEVKPLARPSLMSRRGGGEGKNGVHKRTISPIKFDDQSEEKAAAEETEAISVTSSTDEPSPRKNLTLITRRNSQPTQEQSESIRSPPIKSPPLKSPTGRSLPARSPTTAKSPPVISARVGTPKGVTPPSAAPSSRRSSIGGEERRQSVSKVDDSLLDDMDDLLNEDTGEMIDTNYDDLGNDDLLNEMEELLA